MLFSLSTYDRLTMMLLKQKRENGFLILFLVDERQHAPCVIFRYCLRIICGNRTFDLLLTWLLRSSAALGRTLGDSLKDSHHRTSNKLSTLCVMKEKIHELEHS